MNARIAELAKEAGLGEERWNTTEQFNSFLERFAQLISQECVNVLYDNGLWGTRTSYTLNEHFGVKE